MAERYWFYSDDDIRCWQEELEQQIVRLTVKKARAEAQLTRAEASRLNWQAEEWASLLRQFN